MCGSKNVKDFEKWQQRLNEFGYTNYCEILNSKDYGIPQNRKRCFMVSILGEYNYTFPRKMKLKHRLEDLLEDADKIDERYFLSEETMKSITEEALEDADKKSQIDKGGEINEVANLFEMGNKKYNRRTGSVVDPNGSSSTILARFQGDNNLLLVKNATEKGYLEAEKGDGVDVSGRMKYHRGTVQKGVSQTLTTMGGNDVGVVVPLKRGYSCEVKKETKESDNVEVVGNYSKSEFGQTPIVSKKGIAPTITENHGQVAAIYTETEKQLFTEDGNIKRYLGGEKIDEFKEGQMATTTFPNGYGHGPRTHDESVALNTVDRPSVKQNLRIRKLLPVECVWLMGFERKDYNAMREIGLGDGAIYHVAGDSIVTTCLVSIIGNMLVGSLDQHIKIVENYVEKLKL